MKGIYVSLTRGDLASYRVTLDARGQELSRERLRPAWARFGLPRIKNHPSPGQAPPVAARVARAAVPHRPLTRGMGTRFNSLWMPTFSRPALSSASAAAGAGGRGGMISGGATDDDMAGFGPVAL